MPHITIECSSNVNLDFQCFFAELCQRMIETGHAPGLGMKCRVIASDDYYIIDGNPDYMMINLLIRIREGRTNKVMEEFSNIGMDLLKKYMHEEIKDHRVILSTEIRELIKGKDLTFNSIRKGIENKNSKK